MFITLIFCVWMAHSESKPSKTHAQPEPVVAAADELDGKPFFNRELSWLEFNRHVLEEATDDSLPVLERLKFLSIFSTNLDEFFMIRVSGLKEQIHEGIGGGSPDRMTAAQQIHGLYSRASPLLPIHSSYLLANALPPLATAGA